MDKNYWREYDRRRHEEALPAYHALMKYYPLTLEDLDGEIWKPIAGFDDYQVSNFGRVKSFKQGKTIIRKPQLRGKYLSVDLYIDGKEKYIFVHVLVAKAFIPNLEGKPEVNHDDGNKFNCHVSNLYWATGSENVQHAVKNGLKKSGVENSCAKIKDEKDIIYIRDNPDNLSPQQLAEMFGMSQMAISAIQTGKTYENASGTVRGKKQGGKPRVPDEIRAQIKADWATGLYTQRELAEKYGVSQPTICRIIREG